MNQTHPSDLATTFNPIPSATARRRAARQTVFAIVVSLAANHVMGAEIDKANNADNLNLTASWVQAVLPGTNDIATWNATVTSANTTSLGASTQWLGIRVTTPGGPVTVAADGNTLTNGNVTAVNNVGIDLSTANQNLTLSNNVVVSGVQSWNIGSGETLTVGAGLTRNEAGVILFHFADNTSTVIITNGSAIVASNATPSAMLGGTAAFGNVYFGTVNDTDFAALVPNGGGLQVVPGASISQLYQTNGSANLDPGNANVIDVVTDDAATFGQRASNGRTWNGFRFNIPQANSNVGSGTYKGLNSWEINIPSGRTVTCNAILITTNVGACPVLINNGAQTGGTTGIFRIGSGGTQDLLVYQNNPAAPLVVQPNINLTQQGTGTLVKMGVGTMIVQSPADSYTGGTKVYGGTLEIDGTASVGVGPLNVFGGNFSQSSGTTNSAPSTIFGVGTNSILINSANGAALDNSNVTFNSGSHVELVYSNSVSPSATTAALFVTNVSSGLTVSNTITVDVLCGSLSLGQFPLIKYAGTIGGDGGGAFVLGVLEPHAQGYISNNLANSSIDLVVTNITQPIKWAAGTGVWDIAGSFNWLDTLAASTTYQQNAAGGDNVIFDDSASGSGPFTVTLNQSPTPSSATFNNNTKAYTLSGNGSVSGIGSVTMGGPGTLFLQTTNNFTGGMNINNGVVNFVTLSNLGGGPINFGGGTLQYASGTVDDISVRAVTLNAGGGTIDVNGNAVSFAHPIGNAGAGGLTVTNGTLQITGTNKYSGNTLVSSGSILAFTAANTYISNSAALVVSGTLDASAATGTSGFGLVLGSSANQQLVGTGTVKGEISTSSGTAISPATNGVFGTLNIAGDLTVNGGTINMDIAGPHGASKDMVAITAGSGSGNLTLNGGLNSGVLLLNVTSPLSNGVYGLITYPGTLAGAAGNLMLQGFSQPGSLAYLTADAGTINLNVIPGATNSLTWTGQFSGVWDNTNTANWSSNGVSGQTYQNGDKVTFDDTGSNPGILLGDNGAPGSGAILPGSVTINATNNNYTFSDGVGDGSGQWLGPMTLTINGGAANVTTLLTPNGNSGTTTINSGTLQVGNGITTADIGTGNIVNKGSLIFDQTDNRSVPGQISGTGTLTQEGTAGLILLANNTYTGSTTIGTGSTLQVGTGAGVGTLGTGPVTNNGTLFIDRSGSVTLSNVTGSGSVIFAGGAAFTLGGTNTWLGATYLTNGSIKLATNNQIPNAVTVAGSTGNVGVGGILDLNGFNQDVNGLTDLGLNTGRITNSAAAGTNILTIGMNAPSNSLLYTGTIVDVTNRSGIGLVINNPGTVQLAAVNTYRGGTIVGGGATLNLGTGGSGGIPGNTSAGTGGIIMSNGTTLFMNGNSITVVGNPLTIAPGATVSFNSQALGDQYTGLISGSAGSTNLIAGPWTAAGAGTSYNGFSGTVLIPTLGDLRFFASPCGGTNTTFDITGTGIVQTRTTEVVFLGTLIGNGSFGFDTSLNLLAGGITAPNAGSTGNFVIGSANTSSTYRGTISGANNIYKTGTGTLTLIGSTNVFTSVIDGGTGLIDTNYFMTNGLSYVGSTTISNGVLAIVAPANLNGTNFTSFLLASNTAVLDLSSAGYTPDGTNLITNSSLLLGSGQTLTGLGTIRGSLIASNGTTVSVALPSNTNGFPTTGLLNITNSVELGGTVNININATNTPNCGEIVSPNIVIDPTAALVVTNLGPQAGATFQLFSTGVTFSSITLPTLTGTNMWVTNLSLNGSITLLAPPIVTGPTTNANITSVSLSGTNLLIHGTNNNVPNTSFHYAVLSSTNIATPLSNWTAVVTNGFNANGTFDYTNPVVPGTPQQFIDVKAVP